MWSRKRNKWRTIFLLMPIRRGTGCMRLTTKDPASHRQGCRVAQPFPIWRVGSSYNPGPTCAAKKKSWFLSCFFGIIPESNPYFPYIGAGKLRFTFQKPLEILLCQEKTFKERKQWGKAQRRKNHEQMNKGFAFFAGRNGRHVLKICLCMPCLIWQCMGSLAIRISVNWPHEMCVPPCWHHLSTFQGCRYWPGICTGFTAPSVGSLKEALRKDTLVAEC